MLPGPVTSPPPTAGGEDEAGVGERRRGRRYRARATKQLVSDQAAGSPAQNRKRNPARAGVSQRQREISAQDRKSDLQTSEPPVHPHARSKQQPSAMYETSVGTIARSQRQLGTAQCEAELCRATCWNFQHDMKRTILRVGLPLAAWITDAALPFGWSPVRSAGGSAAIPRVVARQFSGDGRPCSPPVRLRQLPETKLFFRHFYCTR